MVLVDTSVWVDHFRKGRADLELLLNDGQTLCHPFIIGELACGNLGNRAQILTLLRTLPQAELAEEEEVMDFIEQHILMGTGLGYIDMHLLVSAVLTNAPFWTLDKKLAAVSASLGLTR